EPTLPVLLFCAVFGLSMDYEVLLLSRIQEEYRRSGDNTVAVGEGLARSGRLITSAAAIMVAVFAAFALARVVLVKAMGLGMAVAVALDATLVRVLMVPATMRLFGDLNWWAPRPLARLWARARGARPADVEDDRAQRPRRHGKAHRAPGDLDRVRRRLLVEPDGARGADREARPQLGGERRIGRVEHAHDEAPAALGGLHRGEQQRARRKPEERTAGGEQGRGPRDDAPEPELRVPRRARRDAREQRQPGGERPRDLGARHRHRRTDGRGARAEVE